MGDDFRTDFLAQSTGSAVMVGVTVGDEHRVDALEWHADRAEARLERDKRFMAGHAGVDDGDTAFVFEHVHVDVTKTRQVDGQLCPQDSGGQFGDLVRGVERLLAHGAGGVGLRTHGPKLLERVGSVVGEFVNAVTNVVERPVVAGLCGGSKVSLWKPSAC